MKILLTKHNMTSRRKGEGGEREEQVSLQADADVDDDDAADYDGALNRHRPTSAVSRYPHHVQPPPSPR